ncbi:MAG: hypothetical protein KC503_17805 [Myxococcales bacterium]|nr:hypothetical protein [Myxococcales bacterium]
MATSATNVIEGPEVGVILDGRYMLVERRAAVAGRPSYLARDLIDDTEVELIVTGQGDTISEPRYRVRGRARAAAIVRRRRRTMRDAKRQARREHSVSDTRRHERIPMEPRATIEHPRVTHADAAGDAHDTIVGRVIEDEHGEARISEADIEHEAMLDEAAMLDNAAMDKEAKAFDNLRRMVALTGAPRREGHAVVYRGVERRSGRAVRVIVELDE